MSFCLTAVCTLAFCTAVLLSPMVFQKDKNAFLNFTAIFEIECKDVLFISKSGDKFKYPSLWRGYYNIQFSSLDVIFHSGNVRKTWMERDGGGGGENETYEARCLCFNSFENNFTSSSSQYE